MKLRSILFAAVCVVQLAVPLSLVVQHEQTRANGTPWKFKTAPVDPNDPFRGRFVRLSYAIERDAVPFADTSTHFVPYDTRMYAELATGADGYARLVRLHAQRPKGVEYLDVFTRQPFERKRGEGEPEGAQPSAVFVHLPFDRWYLSEDRARNVEAAYANANRAGQANNTYAEVRVRNGHAALVGLVLNGAPVDDVR